MAEEEKVEHGAIEQERMYMIFIIVVLNLH